MNYKYLLLLQLAFGAGACNSENPSAAKIENQPATPITNETAEASFKRGEVIKEVVNIFDSSQSFCLFIPLTDTLVRTAILFFDPQGDGTIPVKRYRAVAEEYGLILAGSNDSKNGLKPEQAAAIAKHLLNDVMTRLKLEREKIITSGFSGGARVAVQTAINEGISGVIGCGAGFPSEPFRSYEFPFVGMVGNEDFNYLEMKRLHKKLETLGMRHQLVVFDGEHEWPTPERMELAILCLNDLAEKRNVLDDRQVTELLASDSAYLFTDLHINEIDQKEAAQQTDIAQAFSKRDFKTLSDKINVFVKSGTEAGEEQKLSNKRLLNFMSLMGFLYSEKALSVDLALAGQYLNIYGKTDYDNPDYHYLQACYFAKSGKTVDAVKEIKKSIEYGFNNYEKMTSDKSLDNLRGEADFRKLVDSLKTIQ